MKRLFALMFLALPLLAGCGKGDDGPDADSGASINEEEGNGGSGSASDGKTLIVFFSRAGENYSVGYVEKGNTKVMAEYIKEATGADVFEIVPEVAYPDDYQSMLTVSQQETADNARPKFKGSVENLESYGNIFIGSPIWYGNPPKIMETFYEAYPSLKNKTIIPFGTHAGSGIGSCTTLLKKYFHNAKYLESLGISGASVRDAASKTMVENWVKKIGLAKET